MAKSSIDVAVADVFQELTGAAAIECYLDKVDLLCTPGALKLQAASELEGVLADVRNDFVSGKLSRVEQDEVLQYVRAHGLIVKATLHGWKVCYPGYEPGYAEYATGGFMPANFEKLIKAAQTSPSVPKFPDGGLCK